MKPLQKAQYVQTLAKAPLLRGLSAEALEEVAAKAREKRVETGNTLFREGEPASALYLV